MQVWLRDERSSEPMSGESLQVAPTLTRPICRRAAQECSMHTVQRALAVRASVKCSGRRTFAGGMIKSAHGGRADTTVSMRPCSESCCVREAASRGAIHVRFRLPFALLSVDESGVHAGDLARKMDGTRVYLPISSCSTIVQSNLISWAPASVDFTPESSLGSRQLGASMELDAGAARRLREALDILASGELPECPVCKPPRA